MKPTPLMAIRARLEAEIAREEDKRKAPEFVWVDHIISLTRENSYYFVLSVMDSIEATQNEEVGE